ncbi:phage terminase large subunit [Sporosarcina sp. resist]|nr:phage terminase large subunit [Sporosarcina sp. resist]
MDLEQIKHMARIELANREFFYFCHLLAPDFYAANRQYLVDLCDEMQAFYESDDDVLIVNVPPRHGKSRTAVMLAQWIFGQNQEEKVMTGSYNETLSTMFSKGVRNGISEEKADKGRVIYKDIFPNVHIKQGDAAMNLWSLEGGYNNYLATSPTGTATGFGASVLIIDDLIKNSLEAYNALTLEKHWDWFTNTMLSRLEEGGKIILIMTRWANNDLAGMALEHFKGETKAVRHVLMKALQDDGSMLCPAVLSKDSYDMKVRAMGEDIASANYQQEPIDVKGILYKVLQTYDSPPRQFERIVNYTDTADEGSDYLCSIIAGVYQGEIYILDVYYTQDGMEITEKETASFLVRNNVNRADIESNNGGKGFARNVKRIIWEEHHTRKVVVKWFHQSKNKMARILSESAYVQDHVYFPHNWKERWPEFYKHLTEFQKVGKNLHDDAPDALTGIVEKANYSSVSVLK